MARAGVTLWLVALVSLLGTGVAGLAAPGGSIAAPVARYAPRWMNESTAERLALGFDVLVPAAVPVPLAGEPNVTTTGEGYTLSWANPGTSPTFLEVVGTRGGTLPEVSAGDPSVRLEQNATVRGVPAYRDRTPVTDAVHWQAGDVVYSVSSGNLFGTDSLRVAEGLVSLTSAATQGDEPTDGGGATTADNAGATLGVPETVRAGEVATVDVTGASGAILTVDSGIFPAIGDRRIVDVTGPVDWEAPTLAYDLSINFVLTDGATGQWLATTQTFVPAATTPPDEDAKPRVRLEAPAVAGSAESVPLKLFGEGSLVVNVTLGSFPAQPPNTTFSTTADGGPALIGTLAAGGSASLVWLSPTVVEPVPVSFFVSDVQTGSTPVIWTMIVSQDPPPEPTPTATPAPSPSATATPASEERAEDGEDGQPAAEDAAVQETPAATGSAAPSPAPSAEPTPPPSAPPTEPATVIATATAITIETPSAAASPSVLPTATLAPTSGLDGLVAGVFGSGGGELSNPAGASLRLPEGALTEDATVSIVPVPDPQLPVLADIDLIPGTGFDVSVATASGNEVNRLEEPATLRVLVPPAEWRLDAVLYRLNGGRAEPLAGSALDRDGVSAQLTRFSRFAIGVPVAGASAERGLLPWIVAGTAAVAVLVFGSIAVGLVRHRRPRAVVTRRPRTRGRVRY